MGTPGSAPPTNDLETLKARLTYAWNVWEFHGRQRMSMFYYFLVIVGILVNGYITALKEPNLRHILPEICVLGLILSPIFLVIDWRNRKMLYFADELLRESEERLSKITPSGLAGPLSRREKEEGNNWLFKRAKMKYWIWTTYIVIGVGFLIELIRSI
jgi:hypothetical protein